MNMYADGFLNPATARLLPKKDWDTFDPTTAFVEYGEPLSHFSRVDDPDLRIMENYLKTPLNDDKKPFIDYTKSASSGFYQLPLSVRVSAMTGSGSSQVPEEEEEDISELPRDELAKRVDALIPGLQHYHVATDPAYGYYMAEQYLRGTHNICFAYPCFFFF